MARHPVTRIWTLLIAGVFYATAAAGAHGGGTSTTWLNQYFLPAHAQVSGVSGLIFGVFLPFLLVAILLYTVLDQFNIFRGRQAKAIALIISLFIIPSGGYQVISEFFLAVFSLGNTSLTGGGGFTVQIPGVGQAGTNMLISVIAFFVSVFIINNVLGTGNDLSPTEYVAAAGAAFAVWLALTGGVSIISVLVGWVIMLWFGWEIFKRGMGAGGLTGIAVGLVGLFVLFSALQRFEFLPQSIRSLSATITGTIPIVVIGVVVLTAVGLVIYLG